MILLAAAAEQGVRLVVRGGPAQLGTGLRLSCDLSGGFGNVCCINLANLTIVKQFNAMWTLKLSAMP